MRHRPKDTKLQTAGNNTMHKLLSYSAVDEAFVVFKALVNHQLPPPRPVTSLLLQAAARQSKTPIVQYVLDTLDSGVIPWDDVLVGNLLEILSQAGHPKTMTEVVDNYAASQSDQWAPNAVICSLMIKAHAQAGNLDAAIDWLQRYRREHRGEGRSEDPYVHLLYGFAHRPGRGARRRENTEACYKILKQMELDGVDPSVKAVNIVLSMELRKWNFRRIAAVWRVLSRRPAGQHMPSTVRPDAATYAIMFKCLENRGLSNMWRPLMPSGRELFRHMLASHHAATGGRPWVPSPHLNAATINVSLRYFMVSRDYAAALVALRTFEVSRLVPTEHTEWIVASMVLKRMGREVQSILKAQAKERHVDASYVKWVDRMHGRLLRAESALLEHRHIEGVLREMKTSQRARKVLPAEEVDRAERLLESLGYHTTRSRLREDGPGASKVDDPTPLLERVSRSGTRRVNLAKSLALLKQSITAELASHAPGGILDDEEWAFKEAMAAANAELLPPRRNKDSPASLG